MRLLKLFRMPEKRILFLALIFLVLSAALFARGKKEEEKLEPINNQFILLITTFDVSSLPPGQQILGSIFQRELFLDLNRIHYRTRNEEEISRYEELARIAATHQAAVRLASKHDERDSLLFMGIPDWKYKKEITRIDKELRELEEAYNKAAEGIPLIADNPLFVISEHNSGGNFPLPPGKGDEDAFLKANNADAFLEARLRLVYGRVYAEFRFFTRGASFIYEDSTIFSQEDLNTAVDEIKSRFLTALVNSEPVMLQVTAEPDHARLEINGRLVKSGNTVELPPGHVNIRVSAEDHQTVEREIELSGGDSREIAFILKPFTMETLGVNLGEKGFSVYMGAMYLGGIISREITEAEDSVGETKKADYEGDIIADSEEDRIEQRFFSIYVPIGQYRYIRVDTEDGLTGEAIVRGRPEDEIRNITLQPRKLPGKDDKPVEDKRKKFYGAYGRFWIALPVAFLTYGIYQAYNNAYNISMYQSGNNDLYNGARSSYYVSIGTWAVAGVFLVETLVRMGIYVRAASNESVPFIE